MRMFRPLLTSRPVISTVVIMYNMEREARRTLHSLSSRYQVGVDPAQYEVIVIDNGSTVPLSHRFVRSFGANFHYFFFDTTSPSPAAAVNFGVAQSGGWFVGIFVDGARILSPGILKYTLAAMQAFNNPIITTLGWHLGPGVQNLSIENGYDETVEEQLLGQIKWPENGYRLFEISALGGSSCRGYFGPLAESNGIFLSHKLFKQLSGFDERFDLPGGGLVNLDFYRRALSLPGTELIMLLGEGTFHQIHGGVMTNISQEENIARWHRFEQQYIHLRGGRFQIPERETLYLGSLPPQALKAVKFSTDWAIQQLAAEPGD